jgi:hypothetical protein
MKASLEFNLPEDKNEFEMASNASKIYYILREIDEQLRGFLKYGHQFSSVEQALSHVRDTIGDMTMNENVNIYHE